MSDYLNPNYAHLYELIDEKLREEFHIIPQTLVGEDGVNLNTIGDIREYADDPKVDPARGTSAYRAFYKSGKEVAVFSQAGAVLMRQSETGSVMLLSANGEACWVNDKEGFDPEVAQIGRDYFTSDPYKPTGRITDATNDISLELVRVYDFGPKRPKRQIDQPLLVMVDRENNRHTLISGDSFTANQSKHVVDMRAVRAIFWQGRTHATPSGTRKGIVISFAKPLLREKK